MKEVIERVSGMPYYFETSDFCKGCWHIYASNYKDSWVENIFSEEKFIERFEELQSGRE